MYVFRSTYSNDLLGYLQGDTEDRKVSSLAFMYAVYVYIYICEYHTHTKNQSNMFGACFGNSTYIFTWQPRFELPYLQKDLYAWVLDNAVCFERPIPFKPASGPQTFMTVNQDFWQNFNLGNLDGKKQAEKLFLITLGIDETQSILVGDQRFLLRSQRVGQTGRVHLAVKALDFAILGSVEFGAQMEFKSYTTFRRWNGYKDCNTSEIERNVITNRLKAGKSVYAIELRNPQQATESLRWISCVSRFTFMFTMFYAYNSKNMLLKTLCRSLG